VQLTGQVGTSLSGEISSERVNTLIARTGVRDRRSTTGVATSQVESIRKSESLGHGGVEVLLHLLRIPMSESKIEIPGAAFDNSHARIVLDTDRPTAAVAR
jgi:hypothetical protein